MKYILAKNISTIIGIGYISKMPGTLGSLVGLIIGTIGLKYLPLIFFLIFFFLLIILSVISIYIYQLKEGKHDRSEIIIDEFIGQILVLIFLEINILNALYAFLLFRFFDIIKFYPANYIDKKYSGCIGIVLDDIVAAIQALLIIFLLKQLPL